MCSYSLVRSSLKTREIDSKNSTIHNWRNLADGKFSVASIQVKRSLQATGAFYCRAAQKTAAEDGVFFPKGQPLVQGSPPFPGTAQGLGARTAPR